MAAAAAPWLARPLMPNAPRPALSRRCPARPLTTTTAATRTASSDGWSTHEAAHERVLRYPDGNVREEVMSGRVGAIPFRMTQQNRAR